MPADYTLALGSCCFPDAAAFMTHIVLPRDGQMFWAWVNLIHISIFLQGHICMYE